MSFGTWITYGAGIVAIAGLGYAVGTTTSAGNKEQLATANTGLQKEADGLRTKVSELEGEAKNLKSGNEQLLEALRQCQLPAAPAREPLPDPSPGRRLTIAAGDSGSVQSVTIAVSKIEALYDPLRYQVSAVLSQNSGPPQEFQFEEGKTQSFGGLEILLLKADLNRAQFSVESLSGH